MTKILLFCLPAFVLLACNPLKKANHKTDDVVFTFRKTPCKGKCPIYYMEIHKSGKITYQGKKNVDKIGKYTKNIGKEDVKILIAEFEEAGFFGFEDEYTSKTTDLPTTYISFTNKGKTKKIRDYRGAPDELKTLEEKLENIANSANWTKVE